LRTLFSVFGTKQPEFPKQERLHVFHVTFFCE
jgi:hypothetical protein